MEERLPSRATFDAKAMALATAAFRATEELLRRFANEKRSADDTTAADALNGVTGRLKAIAACLLHDSLRFVSAPAAAAVAEETTSTVPLSTEWLALACRFLERTGCWLCVLVQAMAQVLPLPKKKKGKKKAAAAAEDSKPPPGDEACLAAFRAFHAELQRLLASLRDFLRRASFEAPSFAALFDLGATQFDFLAQEEQSGLRRRVSEQLASSQALSSERIVALLQAKLSMLGNMKV